MVEAVPLPSCIELMDFITRNTTVKDGKV